MCSPECRPSPSSSSSLFDDERRTLCDAHKFNTADKSQVCDGRNWDLFRDAAKKSKNGKGKRSTSKPKTESVNADAATDKIKSRVTATAKYKPVSSCRLGARDGDDTDYSSRSLQQEEVQQHPLPVEILTAAKGQSQDDKKSQRTSLEEVQATKREESASPTSEAPTKQQDDQYHPSQASSSTSSRCGRSEDEDVSPEKEVPTKQQKDDQDNPLQAVPTTNSSSRSSSSTSSSSRRRSSSSSRRGRPEEEGKPRRLSSDGKEKARRRGSAEGEDKPRRRSSSRRRRHSNEEKVPDGQSLQRCKGKPSRRQSIDSNTTSSDPEMSGARVTVRKLSEPMHRCSTTNQTVSGIMRPARYSSNNLAAMANPKPDPPMVRTDPIIRRRASMTHDPTAKGTITRSVSSLDFGVSSGLSGSSSFAVDELAQSFHSESRFLKTHDSCESVPDDMPKAEWVASGVNFSRSMEVYLFKT